MFPEKQQQPPKEIRQEPNNSDNAELSGKLTAKLGGRCGDYEAALSDVKEEMHLGRQLSEEGAYPTGPKRFRSNFFLAD